LFNITWTAEIIANSIGQSPSGEPNSLSVT